LYGITFKRAANAISQKSNAGDRRHSNQYRQRE
jgi:hypothetical protein